MPSSTSTPADPSQHPAPAPDLDLSATTPPHFLADLYTFLWSELNHASPLSASVVALCLFVGIAVGHPSGGLIAGGGAFTVIRDGRRWFDEGGAAAGDDGGEHGDDAGIGDALVGAEASSPLSFTSTPFAATATTPPTPEPVCCHS